MISRTTRSRGFTLLELLVAMSMMVVVGSCLYSTLYTAFNARRLSLIAVEPDTTALNVLELMKQDFMGAVGPAGNLTGSFVATDSRFGADDTDGVIFYTTSISSSGTITAVSSGSTTPVTAGSNATPGLSSSSTTNGTNTQVIGGVAKIEFALVDNERQSNYRLVRRVTTNLLSTNEQSEEQVLCRSVQSLNFRFYDGNDWVDTWDSTSDTDANSLPLAVEIEIAISYDPSHATGAASVLSYDDRITILKGRDAYKTRRLREAFIIPCGGKAHLASTTTGTGTSTGSGSTGGGASGGGGGTGGGGGSGGTGGGGGGSGGGGSGGAGS